MSEAIAIEKISPNSLIVLTTDQCTATCSHCCMNSSSKRRTRVDHDLMVKTITRFKEQYNIKVVVFAGGEPTLLKGSLLAAISVCRQLKIVSRIVTNASWAINEEKATRGFQALYTAGLNEVNISCDDYHDPFIPFERIKIAWKAARKFPFRSLIIANARHKGSKLTPEYICAELGEELPMRFDEEGRDEFKKIYTESGTQLGISNAPLQRLGRAQDFFEEEHVDTRYSDMVLNQPCPNAIKMPALTPDGSLVACCGFELNGNPILDFGSLKTKDVKQLVDSANDNIIASVIGKLGPGFLVKFANKVSPGIIPEKKYAGICEACQDVVQNEKVINLLFEHRFRLAAVLHNFDKLKSETEQMVVDQYAALQNSALHD